MSMHLFDVRNRGAGPVTNGPNGPAAPDGDMEVLPRAPRHPSEKSQIPGSGCNSCGPALVPWLAGAWKGGKELTPGF